MRSIQTSIRRYFPATYIPPPPKDATFLDLPYHVRRQIYLYAGLVRKCPIDLNSPKSSDQDGEYISGDDEGFHNHQSNTAPYKCLDRNNWLWHLDRDLINDSSESVHGCHCEPLPSQLLFVARRVYNDVVPIIYSQNRFTVSVNHHNRLRPLLRLGSRELSHLALLTVRLDACTCVGTYRQGAREREDRDFYGSHPKCFHPAIHLRTNNWVASEWSNIATRLAQYIQPNNLDLTLVCGNFPCQSSSSAVVGATSALKLRECRVRLGTEKDPTLSGLAESTCLSATDRITASSFPFASLPSELQQNIFYQSDLVYDKTLEWNPIQKVFTTNDWRLSWGQPPCCGTCARHDAVCCCSVQFSAFSSTCTCASASLQKLLVSRKVREQASRAFYTCNDFSIGPCTRERDHPFDGNIYRPAYERTEVLTSFLASMRPADLQLLRRLSFSTIWVHPAAIELLKTSLHTPQLHLTLHINGDSGHNHGDWGAITPYTPEQAA